MPLVRRKALPAADAREGVLLAGVVDGVNLTFTTPDAFIHAPPGLSARVHLNGQRLLLTDDYTVAESGGPGTGFDTVVLLHAPVAGDKVFADYFVV